MNIIFRASLAALAMISVARAQTPDTPTSDQPPSAESQNAFRQCVSTVTGQDFSDKQIQDDRKVELDEPFANFAKAYGAGQDDQDAGLFGRKLTDEMTQTFDTTSGQMVVDRDRSFVRDEAPGKPSYRITQTYLKVYGELNPDDKMLMDNLIDCSKKAGEAPVYQPLKGNDRPAPG